MIDNVPPKEVFDSAETLSAFFAEHNAKHWKFGECASRAYCEELEDTIAQVSKQLDRVQAIADQLLRRKDEK